MVKLKKIDINAHMADISIEDAGTVGEPYPTHNVVPVLLYIGDR